MNNREKLENAGVLKITAKLKQAAKDAIETLTPDEMNTVMNDRDQLKNIVDSHFSLAGIGTHHIVGHPDLAEGEEDEDED